MLSMFFLAVKKIILSPKIFITCDTFLFGVASQLLSKKVLSKKFVELKHWKIKYCFYWNDWTFSNSNLLVLSYCVLCFISNTFLAPLFSITWENQCLEMRFLKRTKWSKSGWIKNAFVSIVVKAKVHITTQSRWIAGMVRTRFGSQVI